MKANTIGMEERAHTGNGVNVSEKDLRQQFATLRERVLVLEDEKRELQSFAALAAHELLEPLIMADAYAQMVIDRVPDADIDSVENLLALSRGLARARILVESLLQETAAPPRLLEKAPVDLNAIVRDTLELLQPEIVARKAKVATERLPMVAGNAALISGLMKNLLINALKYGPRSGGHIGITATRRGEDWWIGVSSEGPAISAADRQAIFQPFRRGFGERRARGAGLGLSICQRIVERHGGRMDLTSGPDGTGNVFSFYLPPN
jgi:chemotaxis family two-component system sensor kinase Cph1